MRNPLKSMEIVGNHKKSKEILGNHKKSWEIMRNHQGSFQINGYHKKSKETTRNHSKTLCIWSFQHCSGVPFLGCMSPEIFVPKKSAAGNGPKLRPRMTRAWLRAWLWWTGGHFGGEAWVATWSSNVASQFKGNRTKSKELMRKHEKS